jgi:N-methylhydantoinase A
VPRYDGPALPAGARIEGPAIIREPATTVVVYPGSAATVTELGNYLLETEGETSGTDLAELGAVA